MGLFGPSLGDLLVDVVKEAIGDHSSSGGMFESAEKKRQAREYISQAKQYVREGEEIYEKAYSKVSFYAFETEYKLRQHFEYKQKLAKNLGSSVGNTIRNFNNFNIDSKIIEAPTIRASSGEMDLSVFKTAAASCIPPADIHLGFDLFSSDEDYYEAKRQKDEARHYKERMKAEKERLYRYKEQMGEIQRFISSEKDELDVLMEKVNKMTGELNSGMKKDSFSREEADYLKGIHKITERIVNLLSTQFLTDSLSINSKYLQVYDGVKKINQNLPCAPSIHDGSTLDAIKKIIDGAIVY